MSVEKAKLKASVIHEIGVGMDDMLESVERREVAAEGRIEGLKRACDCIQDLQALADKEADEDEDFTPEMRVRVKRWVDRCFQAVANLQMGAEAEKLRAQGAKQQAQKTVALMKKLHQGYANKATALEEWENTPEGERDERRRPPGAHPGNPMAERKRADAEAAKKAKKAPARKKATKKTTKKVDKNAQV